MATGGARAVARCDALGVAPYSDAPDMLFRAWLTPAFAATQQAIAGWMRAAGMAVRIDPATNLVGRYEGLAADAPAMLIGSHIDSVRDAGRYDGPLGVMLGIECVAALNQAGRRLPFAIEVIAFGDEEGSRFPSPMLTSRALAGTLPADALDHIGADGTPLADALAAYGARPPDLPAAARDPATIVAYLEAHIEQGPALEADGLAVGTVTGIAAQARYRVTVGGTAGHAGTSAMALRRDALAAAAEMVLGVERIGGAGAADLVATVGAMIVAPGAPNVIPGDVEFTVDVRALDAGVRDAAAAAIVAEAQRIAARRGVQVAAIRVHVLAPSPCDPALVALMDAALATAGQPVRRLVSGAGHDAMAMAALCPTAMLFIRCRGGISHHPAEHVDPADADVALAVMRAFIDHLELHHG
ncbi:MAG TPA: allantoate amidohydrolase [Sphingomonas sp.]|jgi:allantoate deiminase|nr:allantoate amidohydrolase [Sphingomonas sp.]